MIKMYSEHLRVPIPKDVQDRGKSIARTIKERLPGGIGFCIFLFPVIPIDPNIKQREDQDWIFYISDANRDDIVKVLQGFIQVEGN